GRAVTDAADGRSGPGHIHQARRRRGPGAYASADAAAFAAGRPRMRMTGSEPVAELVGLAQALRNAGLAVDPSRVVVAADALTRLYPPGLPDLYWATRLAFCSRYEDLARFDAVFNAWFAVPAAPADAEPSADARTVTARATD